MNLIGIAGRAGAGKDTAADVLVKEFGFVKVALADPLKRICKEVFQFTDEQLWGPSSSRNAPDERYPRPDPVARAHLTPRYALQTLGTEWGRNCYDNVWVDYAIRVAKALLWTEEKCWGPYGYDAQEGLNGNGQEWAKGVVISDVRFPNEVAAIRAAGGKIWRIIRPQEGLAGGAGQHISETALDDWPHDMFDAVIANNGDSLKNLKVLVCGVARHAGLASK